MGAPLFGPQLDRGIQDVGAETAHLLSVILKAAAVAIATIMRVATVTIMLAGSVASPAWAAFRPNLFHDPRHDLHLIEEMHGRHLFRIAKYQRWL
jgi:hypothetical protein